MPISKEKLVIAIDGPAGSGKSTIAKKVAERLGIRYFDTGALYRYVTYWALEKDIPFTEEEKLGELVKEIDFTVIPEEKIRENRISNNVSDVSKIPAVRHSLVTIQRQAAKAGGVVMEGRDIGSVILPDAQIKIFLTASIPVRAERRFLELKEKGFQGTVQDIEREIERRDRIDSGRALNPLVKAKDAVELDTTQLGIPQVVEEILKIIRQRSG